MNAAKQTGGAAFPINNSYMSEAGMTLRDYFAAKAMQVYLAARLDGDDDDIASDAYYVADAMLRARGSA
jgi:hypothetical protein